jgi:hypothetical protein
MVVFATMESSLEQSSGLQQFPHTPDVIGYARRHRRRGSQGFVNAAEIVKREPACDRGPVVLPTLTEGVRQSGEAAIAHARAEVTALDNRSADAFNTLI